MPNQNYTELKERKANKNNSGPGVKNRKGSLGAEHGSAQKDDPFRWTKPGGNRSKSMNTVGWPIVKSSVVNDGIDQ